MINCLKASDRHYTLVALRGMSEVWRPHNTRPEHRNLSIVDSFEQNVKSRIRMVYM